MSQDVTFSTRLSQHTAKGLTVRGQLLTELAESSDFVSVLWLHLTGAQPQEHHRKLLNSILVLSLTHGVEPASGFVPRVLASTGNDIFTAMAGSLHALGPKHGGAVTPAMEVYYQLAQLSDIESSCRQLVSNYRETKKRIPGYGHPHYTQQDPRAQLLLKMIRAHQLDERFIDIAKSLELALEEQLGRKLILNVDGAIAACLCTLQLAPPIGNALFGLARVGGSIAQIMEELEQNGGVRRATSATQH